MAIDTSQNGRKFTLTSGAILFGTVVQLVAVWRGGDVSAYLAFLAAVTLAFNGANAATTMAWARSEAAKSDAGAAG